MGRNVFQDGPFVPIQVADGSALAGTVALWTAATFTPIFARDPKAAKIYIIRAAGTITTGSSGTFSLSPSYNGSTLGISKTYTTPVNMTDAPWFLEFELVFRTIGGAGSTSTCIGAGYFFSAPKISDPDGSEGFVIPFGGTSATVDVTVDGSFSIQKSQSAAGASMTVQWAYLFSVN